MTTIAFDAQGTVAWDSQATAEDIRYTAMRPKVAIHKGGWVIGFAGDACYSADVRKWFLAGAPEKKKPAGEWGILAWKNGELFGVSDSNPRPYKVELPYAIGSGGTIALTAMRLGKNACEAVEIAVAMDIFSGPPVHSMILAEAVKKKPTTKKRKA